MIKHVKATGLSSVFDGLNPVIFTDEAKNKGVTNNSIIYIKCEEGDENYGELFAPGSTWIWALGEWFAKDTRPITEEEIEEIVFGSGVFPDIPNFEGCNIEIDSALSLTSTNPVQNKVITEEIGNIQDALIIINETLHNL